MPGLSFERLYDRVGPRYFLLLTAGFAASIPLLGMAGVFLSPAYARQTFGDILQMQILLLPVTVVAGVITEYSVARVLQPVSDWVRRRPGADAETTWNSAVLGLSRAVAIGSFVAILTVGLPATFIVAPYMDLHGAFELSALFMGIVIIVGFGASLHFLMWERGLRPVVAEAARSLPPDFRPARAGLPLSRKVVILIVLMNMLTGLVAAGISTDAHGPAFKVALGVGTATIVTLTLSLVLILLLRRSIVRPIADLQAAMGRVQEGDLSTHLLPVSGDEIGRVSHHFNAMVGGLEERKRLAGENVVLQDQVQDQLDQLRESRARIVAASDETRRQVERDLHDGAQQHLVLLRLKLGLMRKKLAKGEDPNAILDDAGEDLERALDELRDLAHGIYPQVLTSDGLHGALEDAAGRASIPTAVSRQETRRYDPDLEAAVYFCCLEALQNVGKHAGESARATVSLREHDGELLFEVADDGPGFDPATVNGSAGMENMSDRIGALGGELRVESSPGQGTRVIGSVPVGAAEGRA